MKPENKVIVITGASSGLGAKTAIHLSGLGAHTVLVARSREGLEKVRSEILALTRSRAVIIPCDISSEQEVSRMVQTLREHYDHVDVLINNAGFGKYRPSQQISNQEMRSHFEVNFFGAFYCIKGILPLMKNQGSGYILNVASLFSLLSFSDVSIYAATKFALAGFTKGLRQELKPENIKVGLLMPASIKTPFQEKKEGDRKSPKFMMLEPEQVAKEIGRMIRLEKSDCILPKWIGPLARLKSAFS